MDSTQKTHRSAIRSVCRLLMTKLWRCGIISGSSSSLRFLAVSSVILLMSWTATGRSADSHVSKIPVYVRTRPHVQDPDRQRSNSFLLDHESEDRKETSSNNRALYFSSAFSRPPSGPSRHESTSPIAARVRLYYTFLLLLVPELSACPFSVCSAHSGLKTW